MEYKKIHLLIIVCLFSIGIFAQSGTEKISVSFSKIPLKEAMTRIEKASGYLFSYDATEINTYGAQNEAYMSRSAEKWVRGLCFNELGVCG